MVPENGKQRRAVHDRASAFHDMERRHRLFDARIDGWSPWRVMRNAVHRRLLALPIAVTGRSNSRRAFRALLETLRFLKLLAFGPRVRVLVKTSRSGLRRQVGERYRDVYFDGLLQRFASHLKLEEINSPDFDLQARLALFPAGLDPVFFTFWGTFLGRILPVPASEFCNRVRDLLQKECGLDLDAGWLNLRISTVYWQSRLYGLLIDRIKPSAILVSDTGEYALRLAAERRSVRFIELQHGVFDADHPDAVPAWVGGENGELLLPDFLACRGTYWIEQLQTTLQGIRSAQPVGNEMIDEARARRASLGARAELHLVVSSQGLDSVNLAHWLADMVAAAPPLQWRLTVKLHPVYDAGTIAYHELSRHPNVSVMNGATPPNIYDLLVEADLHLSIASACHFDALSLGVPSVVIPLEGYEGMASAIAEGLVVVAARPSDVWTLITKKQSAPDANRFSEEGFLENILHLVERPF